MFAPLRYPLGNDLAAVKAEVGSSDRMDSIVNASRSSERRFGLADSVRMSSEVSSSRRLSSRTLLAAGLWVSETLASSAMPSLRMLRLWTMCRDLFCLISEYSTK